MDRTRTALGLVLVAGLAWMGLGCSSDDESANPDPPSGPDASRTTTLPEPRLDIDPRRYYEDYAPQGDEASSTAGGSGGATPAVPAAPQAESTAGAGGRATDVATDVVPPEPGPEPPVPPGEPPEPGVLDDNTFTDDGHNPFVAAADDPESTFGLDVDTGSYNVGRTLLDQGYLPVPESVRTEEWVNAFEYGDEPPAEGDVGVQVEGAPSPFTDDGTQLVRVGVRARPVDTAARPPASITLVVDVSGSMDIRERLGLVRSTVALLALYLRGDDTVSIVTYSDDATVLLEPTPASEAETIVSTIEQLQPTDSTNMEAGLRRGYEMAQQAFRQDGINTVILASDGVANTGVTGTDELSQLVQQEGQEGIGLVTVGFGMGNYNDTLMEQLADRGDGFYAYVDTYEEAERLFVTELTSTLTVVAEDTRAQVTFDPEVVDTYRLLGYENRALADESFEDDSVDAGELGAGHAVTALYEVRLRDGVDAAGFDGDGGQDGGGGDGGGSASLGEVRVRYRSHDSGETAEATASIAPGDLVASFDEASPSLRLAAAVAGLAEVFAQHPQAVERGLNLDRIAEVAAGLAAGPPDDEGNRRAGPAELDEVIDLARSAAPPTPDPTAIVD
jgi:Ca-activated chloride channel homolog